MILCNYEFTNHKLAIWARQKTKQWYLSVCSANLDKVLKLCALSLQCIMKLSQTWQMFMHLHRCHCVSLELCKKGEKYLGYDLTGQMESTLHKHDCIHFKHPSDQRVCLTITRMSIWVNIVFLKMHQLIKVHILLQEINYVMKQTPGGWSNYGSLLPRVSLLCLPCPQWNRSRPSRDGMMFKLWVIFRTWQKNPSSSHPARKNFSVRQERFLAHLSTRKLAPDKSHYNPIPKGELDVRFFVALVNYYIKHCHSNEQWNALGWVLALKSTWLKNIRANLWWKLHKKIRRLFVVITGIMISKLKESRF